MHLADVFNFLSGATAVGIIAHAVNTFPTPKNIYLQWVLGIIKFAVGQRQSALNVVNGMESEVTAVTSEQKEALQNGSVMTIVKQDNITTVIE